MTQGRVPLPSLAANRRNPTVQKAATMATSLTTVGLDKSEVLLCRGE